MRCPTCSETFVPLPFRGLDLEACPRGEWIWLARGRLAGLYEAIVRKSSPRDLASLREECRAREGATAKAIERGAVPRQRCPGCGHWMDRKPLSRVSGIVAHRCDEHGFLVAREGFERFVDFWARGGSTLAHVNLTRQLAAIRREVAAAKKKEAARGVAATLFQILFGIG